MNRRQIVRTAMSASAPFAVLMAAAVCVWAGVPQGAERRKGEPMKIAVTSQAFKEGETIPAKYTCDGANVSPPLAWDVPSTESIRAFALIVDDPDAPVGVWVHWVLWNLPADARNLAENVPPEKTLPSGARQGTNDFRRIGYGGPCPPPGTLHRYFFKVYALNQMLDLAPGATKADLLKAMQGRIAGEGQIMGKYGRKR